MVDGVTTIGHERADLRIYVYLSADKDGSFDNAIMVSQGVWGLLDDTVFVRGRDAAKQFIEAVNKLNAEPVWGEDEEKYLSIGVEDEGSEVFFWTRKADGDFNAGILIEQHSHALNRHFSGTILVDSRVSAEKLVNAIKRRGRLVGWEL